MLYKTPSYRQYRTGLTWNDIYSILRSEQAVGRRSHITRHTILGRWHEIKMNLYRSEMESYGIEID